MAITFRSAATARTTANATSLACNLPAGVQDGDLLVASVQTRPAGTAGAITGMGAWTLLQTSDSGPAHQHRLYFRRALSEPASYTATITTASSMVFVIAAFIPSAS